MLDQFGLEGLLKRHRKQKFETEHDMTKLTVKFRNMQKAITFVILDAKMCLNTRWKGLQKIYSFLSYLIL